MTKSVTRNQMLIDLGYEHADAHERALAILVAARLTSLRKERISVDKRDRCRDALAEKLVLLCRQCSGLGSPDGRTPVPAVDSRFCGLCAGSVNRRSVERAARACRAHGTSKIVVVGGTPNSHTALSELLPRDIKHRIVPGTERHTRRDALANLKWADVVIVWAKTQLDHQVSQLYTKAGPEYARKVIVAQRGGIATLADRLTRHVQSPPPG